jgi:GntR family transcriptional repressor for pyruvate dehydrogenase complex
MPQIIKRQTLTSQVIEYILGLIKTGKVKPGQRLPTEMELTNSLGVSRTCIREAMKSLESLHLISVRPKVGAVVLEPSPTAMFSAEHLSALAHRQQTDILIEFRKILETGMASLAAEKATDEDLAAMKQAMDDHKRAIETDYIVYPADIAFHKAIAAATRNPIVGMVLEMISEPLSEQRRLTNGVPNSAEDGLRDHRRIFRAIREHNPEKARATMRAHMKTAEHYWRLAQASSKSNGDKHEPAA